MHQSSSHTPMGNTFAAIPVTSADGLFSGKELTTAMSLNEYDFHARSLTLFGSFTAPDPFGIDYIRRIN